MGATLQHYLNPLHIYCRLRDIGLSKGKAVSMCRIYEHFVFRYFLSERSSLWEGSSIGFLGRKP